MRVHPDTYPARLQSFVAQTPSGIPAWFDWTDAHVPRTNWPLRFVVRRWTDGSQFTMRVPFGPISYIP